MSEKPKCPAKWTLPEIIWALRDIKYLGHDQWKMVAGKSGRAKTHIQGSRYDALLDIETARAVVAWEKVRRGDWRLSVAANPETS